MKTQIFSVILMALILFSNQAISQTDSTFANQDTTLANKFFARAEELHEKTQYDSSNYYYEKASMIYEITASKYNKLKLWEKYISCINSAFYNFLKQGNYQNARNYLDKLNETLGLGLTKFGEKHLRVADCYDNIGIIYYLKSDYDKAIEYFNKALAIKIELLGENDLKITSTYENIGKVYRKKVSLDKALEYCNKSVAIILQQMGENHPRVATAYNTIGLIYCTKGDLDKALEYYSKALAIKLKLQGENHPDIAVACNNIGLVYSIKGDYGKAIEYYNNSLAIRIHISGENNFRVACTYDNIGIMHFQKGDYDRAMDYHDKSLAIKLKLLDENHLSIAGNYANMSDIFQKMGDYEKALEYHDKCLAITIQKLGENHSDVADEYNDIGDIYLAKDDYNNALEYYNKSLDIKIQIYGKNHPQLASTYHRFGTLYYKQNNFKKALYYLQKSIISSVRDYNDSNTYSNPLIQNILLDKNLLDALELKASAFEKFYSLESYNIEDIKMSFNTYQFATDLIDKIRISYKAEGSKLFLGERATEIFDKAIKTTLKLYEITQDNEYKEQAFLFAEKAKSSVLLTSLQESRAKQFAGIPDSLLEQEKESRIDLSFYETQIQNELEKKEGQDSLKIKEFEAKHFVLNEQYQKLIEKIETEYPKYYDMKYQTHTATISELQRFLDEKSALLSYFIGDSLINIFVVSKDGFSVTSLEKDTLFEGTIKSLNRSIKKLNAYGFIDTSYQAYNLLIKPVEQFISDKEKLIIIPHSNLYKIPYEALLSQKPGKEAQTDFTKLDYLLNRFEISYHYSATLYLNSLNKADKLLAESWRKDNLFIGFAPVFSDEANNGYILASNIPTFDLAYADESDVRSITLDGKRFKELQYSEKEVENIIKMYEKKRSEAIGFFHTDATENNFKSNVGKYKYVHIATHGIINDEKPQLSGIIFSQPTDSVYTEDGILYSNETYNLDLNTDLVVLSSCESGIGKLVLGEGLMALTRGFLYSGTSNIVVSLWKVSDKHTSQLMVEFYKNILDEKSYASSLREAKLKMIESEGTAFPKSWSSFVLLGE